LRSGFEWQDALVVYATAFAMSAVLSFGMSASLSLGLMGRLLYYAVLFGVFMFVAVKQGFAAPVAAGLAAGAASASWLVNVVSNSLLGPMPGWFSFALGLAVAALLYVKWSRGSRRWWGAAVVVGAEVLVSAVAYIAYGAGVFDAASPPLAAIAVLPFDWGPATRVLGVWALVSLIFLELLLPQRTTAQADS
jgi:hypothetical protein